MDPNSKRSIDHYYKILDFFGEEPHFHSQEKKRARKEGFTYAPAIGASHILPAAGKGVLFSSLKNVKIFSIAPDVLETVWNLVDDHLLEGEDSKYVKDERTPGVLAHAFEAASLLQEADEWKRNLDPLVDKVWDEGPFEPYPTNFPFDVMYFGYGDGVLLSPLQQSFRFPDDTGVPLIDRSGKEIMVSADRIDQLKLLSHLVDANGEVFEFTEYTINHAVVLPDGRGITADFDPKGEWDFDFSTQGSPPGLLERAIERANEALHTQGYKPLSTGVEDRLGLIYEERDGRHCFDLVEVIKGYAYYSCRMSRSSSEYFRGGGEDTLKEMEERGLDGYWFNPWTLTPWVVPTLVSLINENNKTFVFSGNYDKETRKSLGKKHRKHIKRKKKRNILPSFYVIDIAPKVVRKVIRSSFSKRSPVARSPLTHRHDRDGHERVVVRRGELPLPPDERHLLTLRGYAIYTDGQPSDADKDRLVRRRHPLRGPGEWLAIKTSWVRSCVVGDDALPYRPAVRRLTKDSIIDLIKIG